MEADLAMTQMAYDINSGAFNRFKGDDRLGVLFYMSPVHDDAESAKEGRPIFKEVEFVKIMIPGDKGNVVVRQAMESDRQRFPRQYANFKNNQAEATIGTPLEQWPMITRAQVEELKYFQIRSVEQLATLSDTHAQKFMGLSMLRERAKDYLAAAAEAAPATQLRAALEERDSQIAALQQAVSELSERLKATESKKK